MAATRPGDKTEIGGFERRWGRGLSMWRCCRLSRRLCFAAASAAGLARRRCPRRRSPRRDAMAGVHPRWARKRSASLTRGARAGAAGFGFAWIWFAWPEPESALRLPGHARQTQPCRPSAMRPTRRGLALPARTVTRSTRFPALPSADRAREIRIEIQIGRFRRALDSSRASGIGFQRPL